MNQFTIFSDSACDMPSDLIQKHGLHIVPYFVSFDGTTYYKERVDISNEEFYRTLRTQKIFPKTSLPPISDYADAFKTALDKGNDVLCFCLSSKFSGSYQSALNAKNMLMEEYPNQTIIIIDSMMASLGQSMQILHAVKRQSEGKSIIEIADEINNLKQNSKIFVTVDSLEYLQRGGRIGKVSAFAGGLLGIKPVIALLDGELNPLSKVRGRKKAITEIIDLTLKDIANNREDYVIGVVHSDCADEGLKLIDMLDTEYNIKVDVPLFELGVTIGTHIGPTVLGISYLKIQK